MGLSPSKSKNLVYELFRNGTKENAGESSLASQTCALTSRKPCCSGKGFTLAPRGAFAFAQLCPCVQTCSACLGACQLVKNDLAAPCRTPSPRKITNLLNEAHIPARYVHSSLEQFSNVRSGNCAQNVDKIKVWLSQFTLGMSKGLVLSGSVGVGKTFVLCSIAKALAEKGITVKFIDFIQLLSEVKAGYSENKADQILLGPLISVDVLVIDELGKGRNTEFEQLILDQLVMGRYNQNKMILASTNCRLSGPDDKFGHLEERVGTRSYSRLLETCHLIELTGTDFRRAKPPMPT